MEEKYQMHRPTPHQKQNSRPTIGLFLPRLITIQQQQWLGVVDVARQQDANLICFDGGELRSPNGFEMQGNVIFDLVEAETIVDGLVIWSGAIDLYLSPAEMREFFRRYHPLPMVSVDRALAGLPSLIVDNKGAMFEAVNHLIEVHGYRRIAFIPGPEGHVAAERYQGYVKALEQHNLPLDPALVPPPTCWWAAEEAIARTNLLLDERTTDVEAIVAANDVLALGVLVALQTRRIRVPDDVAVIGFDDMMNFVIDPDSIEANLGAGVPSFREVMLPLTTVRMPFYEMGRRAAEVLLAQLRGEPVPEIITIPTELIVRRSCGCLSQAVEQMAPEPRVIISYERPAQEAFTGVIAAQREHISAQMKQVLALPASELAPDWADRLLTSFIREVQGGSVNAFLAALDEILHASVRTGDSLESWWPVLFALRQQTLPYLASDKALARTEVLWQRTQSYMQEMAEQFSLYQRLSARKRDQILQEVGQKLITTFDIGQLAEILAQDLPSLGIKSCYLALYAPQVPPDDSKAGVGVGEVAYPTEWSRSVLVYENNERIELPADEALFRSRQLIPTERLYRERPYSMVVEPLYFKDQQLGFIVFEVGLREGRIYKVLRGHLSSALQGALLVEQTQEKNRLLQQEISQRQQAELALQKAHSELEQRVAERTAELATANQFLKEQIVERERAEGMQAKLEAQLRQAQKMEAIGQLAGGIAHDFNNLLVVIIGYSNLLLSHLPGDDPTRKDIEQIKKAGERAAALTRQLLAFSRQQMLQPTILNLNNVVSNIESMLQRLIGEDIKLVTLLEPALASVTADPGQIEQIIVNLAINARDAMLQGGQLTIATANLYLDQNYAQQNVGFKAGPYVVLQVTDTGSGMDATIQARLFEPFFTTKPQGKGTGLGLATVFGIVQQSGGHISVASEPGLGTSFRIYLPQSEQTVEEIEPGWGLIPASPTGSETILLVEDDPGVRTVTRRFLEERGYTILEAAQGLEALQLCQEHQGPIHLLITDVVMPSMSGRELVERLATIRPEIPVLYVSGYTDSAMIRHGVSEASIALLQKPFTADTLARKVREILDVSANKKDTR